MGGRRGLRGAAPRRLAALTAACAVALATLSGLPSSALGSAAPPAGAHRVLLGATPAGAGGNTRWTGVTTLESTIGRQLDFVRVFEVWDAAYPATYHTNVTSSDRIMALSVRARRTDGTVIPWADIASMAPGSALDQELQTWITRMIDVGKPVWFSFNHEPETTANAANGTATDYIAAWRRIVTEFRARGATNVKFVWIMTGNSFDVPTTDARSAGMWYPGDDYVDYIGADAYNWSSCRAGASVPWRSFESVTANIRAFAATHPDKRLVLSELASPEQGGDKAAWIDDAAELLKQPGYEQFLGIAWFDKVDPAYPDCQLQIASSPAATAAFVRLAQDPFFGGPLPAVPPSVTLTSPADGSTLSGDVTLSADVTRGTMPLASVTFTAGGSTVGTDTDGSDGWSATWDSKAVADGPATVTAVATDTWGLTGSDSATVAIDNIPPLPVAVLVTSQPASPSAAESAVRARLVGLGYDVRLADDDTVTASGVADAALVIVGHRVTNARVATVLRGVTTTVWVAKATLLDDFRMTPKPTSNYGTSSTTTITVAAPGNAMAGGQSGTVRFLTSRDSVSWGRPTSAARVVATVGGRATVFVYRPGRTLVGGNAAPACRMAFPLVGTAPTRHTSAAWSMFDATVGYAASGC